MTAEPLVFTKASGSIRLADGRHLLVQGGDPIVRARLAEGELERLQRIAAVGDHYEWPEWQLPPAVEHRQLVQRAMGLDVEPGPARPAPLERREVDPNVSDIASGVAEGGLL